MSKNGKAIGKVDELRDKVIKAVDLGTPHEEGHGPKGNPSRAGQNKPKKDGNRKKRGKGRH